MTKIEIPSIKSDIVRFLCSRKYIVSCECVCKTECPLCVCGPCDSRSNCEYWLIEFQIWFTYSHKQAYSLTCENLLIRCNAFVCTCFEFWKENQIFFSQIHVRHENEYTKLMKNQHMNLNYTRSRSHSEHSNLNYSSSHFIISSGSFVTQPNL